MSIPNKGVDRRISPLLHPGEVRPPSKARQLLLEPSPASIVRPFIAAWHSRLPTTQAGPWRLGFVAHHGFTCYGAALWHNPSARVLPQDWLELRRLAIPDDAPPHTASWMLGAMRKWINTNLPDVPRLISYQDLDVHEGTIYKAAGWSVGYVSTPRQRDRNIKRNGTRRAYRSDLNGAAPASAGKARWEISVGRSTPAAEAIPLPASIEPIEPDLFGDAS